MAPVVSVVPFLERTHAIARPMSRPIQTAPEMRTVPAILRDLRERLDAASARIELTFPYFLERVAPVSGAKALMDFETSFIGTSDAKGDDFVLKVKVPVTSLCPCSKAISEYGAHNQRGYITISVRTYPAPGEVLQLAGPPPVVSFQRFATRIFLGDLDGAALVLAELFELEVGRARKCAQVFYDVVRHNPEVIAKAAQLRRELQAGGYSTALMLLHECFGLQGVESISVMQSLRARIERSTY